MPFVPVCGVMALALLPSLPARRLCSRHTPEALMRMQGTVMEHDAIKRKVMVLYEDGDEERMTVSQLKHFLVPDDPTVGRRQAPAPASQPRSAAAAPQVPTAASPVGIAAAAAQPPMVEQPRDTAAIDAEAAATMASWAPSGSKTAANAVPAQPLASQLLSGANGPPAELAPGAAAEEKPSAQQADPIQQQSTVQMTEQPVPVLQLPPAGSAHGGDAPSARAPEQPQEAESAAAASGVGGGAMAAESSQRPAAAASLNGAVLTRAVRLRSLC